MKKEESERRKNPKRNKTSKSRRNRYVSLDQVLARVGVPRQLDGLALEVLRQSGLHERLYVRRGEDATELERSLLDMIEALSENEIIHRREVLAASRRNPGDQVAEEVEADPDAESDEDEYEEDDEDDWGAAA